MLLRNGKTVYKNENFSRYIRDKFYSQMRRVEGERLNISSKLYRFQFADDDYFVRIPFFQSSIVYSNIDEYKKIVFLCIDVLLLKSDYNAVMSCVNFRKRYYLCQDIVNKLRREYCVEYIFARLREVFDKSVLLEKTMMGRGGGSCEAEVFRNRFLGVSLYPEYGSVGGYGINVYSLMFSVNSIRKSVVPILFYKEILVLKMLLLKFDYPVVECICKYYIGSDLFINFADLV